MTNFTPEMIEKAKTTKSPEELLELAKAEQVALTSEEAAEYFEMLNPKMGELADDDLENVSGGGCKTKVNNRKYTVVSSGLKCFTGQFEAAYDIVIQEFPSDRDVIWKRTDNLALRKAWDSYCGQKVSGETCGWCRHLEFKAGTGYCGKS